MQLLSRRQVLLAGLGGLVLVACGDGDDSEGDSASTSGPSSSAPEVAGGLALRSVFSPQQPAGVEVRLPLAIGSAEGHFDVETPEIIRVTVTPPGGSPRPAAEIGRRSDGIPIAYYPLRTTLDAEGRWQLAVDTGEVTLRTTVDAVPRSAFPAVPGPGDRLPMITTPTVSDARGVDPICTREPACPYHEVPLDRAMSGSGPVALIVSTPKFCQTAICGPVLDLLVARRSDLDAAGVTVIHAEVYVDEDAEETTETVKALGLQWEPSLLLATPGGTVADRLDYTFDATELAEVLAKLVP